MKITFFDLETNGLPKSKTASILELDNWPRCIELAWQVCDTDPAVIEIPSNQYLIQPEGWTMPTEKFWTDHGFTQERSIAKGFPIAFVLEEFIKDVNQSDLLVAHNIDFDQPVLGAEMVRAGKRTGKKVPKICTMQSSIEFCKIRFSKDYRKEARYKFPKLSELYMKLFNRDFEGAHHASSDVTATRECFFELVKLGVIKLPEIQNA